MAPGNRVDPDWGEVMTEELSDVDVAKTQSDERYFVLSDLLRYTFKMPSPFRSRVAWIKGRGVFPRRERIYPIAYRGEYLLAGISGVVAVMGGDHPFVWMTADGRLVHYGDTSFEFVSLYALVEGLASNEYELLVLWLSNDAQGAQALIESAVKVSIESASL